MTRVRVMEWGIWGWTFQGMHGLLRTQPLLILSVSGSESRANTEPIVFATLQLRWASQGQLPETSQPPRVCHGSQARITCPCRCTPSEPGTLQPPCSAEAQPWYWPWLPCLYDPVVPQQTESGLSLAGKSGIRQGFHGQSGG